MALQRRLQVGQRADEGRRQRPRLLRVSVPQRGVALAHGPQRPAGPKIDALFAGGAGLVDPQLALGQRGEVVELAVSSLHHPHEVEPGPGPRQLLRPRPVLLLLQQRHRGPCDVVHAVGALAQRGDRQETIHPLFARHVLGVDLHQQLAVDDLAQRAQQVIEVDQLPTASPQRLARGHLGQHLARRELHHKGVPPLQLQRGDLIHRAPHGPQIAFRAAGRHQVGGARQQLQRVRHQLPLAFAVQLDHAHQLSHQLIAVDALAGRGGRRLGLEGVAPRELDTPGHGEKVTPREACSLFEDLQQPGVDRLGEGGDVPVGERARPGGVQQLVDLGAAQQVPLAAGEPRGRRGEHVAPQPIELAGLSTKGARCGDPAGRLAGRLARPRPRARLQRRCPERRTGQRYEHRRPVRELCSRGHQDQGTPQTRGAQAARDIVERSPVGKRP